ncbi:hypothetical protein [Paludisphaera mucosa]|uniref:DUF4405 domain-containing protein n=1 Tax=Paludisphaera mucosa TaxID=3030827 RepID=A0ABT6FD12_9BACT|nr:hypothetical protein [Paludisphaera mucosa]MDG3005478.1 hypothetical protein [Paludisphaera mucosa]
MIRSYLVLAVTGASLLLAAFATGFPATVEPRAGGAAWRGVHLLVSLGTVVLVLGIHSIVYTYFMATVKWAKEVSRVYGLPDWLVAQASRNKGRASRFIMGAVAAVAAAAWLGAAADTRGGRYGSWHLAAAGFALGFNAVAFVIEYAGVVSHHRLLAEMKNQADRMRKDHREPRPRTAAEARA